MTIRAALPLEAAALAELAAETFPLACPPGLAAEDIEQFIATQLSSEVFARHLRTATKSVIVAERDGQLLGYALLDLQPSRGEIRSLLAGSHAVELNKFFLLASEHGAGTAAALMRAVLDAAAASGADTIWLGVSRENARANRFYEKHGFALVGTKAFTVGSQTLPEDHVRELVLAPESRMNEGATRYPE
nr:GNAT family N-acetyltransferase [Tessaracoccus sp. OS52]